MSKHSEHPGGGSRGLPRLTEQVEQLMLQLASTETSGLVVLRQFQSSILQIVETSEQEEKVFLLESSVERVLDIAGLSANKHLVIKIHLWLGHQLETFGAWTSALKVFRKVIKLSGDEYRSYAFEALRWSGYIHLMKSNYPAAKKAFSLSLEIARDLSDRQAEALAHNALGYYAFERGEYPEAARHWENALTFAAEIDSTSLIAKLENNLGALANVLGDKEKALAHYGESIPRFEKIGEKRGLAETYHNMGMTFADSASWAEAAESYAKSNELARDIGDVRLQANLKLNRVELYLEIHDWEMAQALCFKALATFQQLEDHLGEGDVYRYLGIINGKRENWADAASYFIESISVNKKHKSPLSLAEAHFDYGRMLIAGGRLKQARKQLQQARKLFKKIGAAHEAAAVDQELSLIPEV